MALEQIAGPEDLISDWYLYKDSPTDGGFIYPGPVSINGQPKLFSFAKKLNSLCIEICDEDPEHDDFILKNGDRIYRGHKMYTVKGIMFALRRIPSIIPDIANLGLESTVQKVLLHPNLHAGGLILVTGETGQGKSTTCAAAIRARMEKFGSFCLTVEDPPELPLHGDYKNGRCIQTEVKSGGFAESLRGAMRSYPTVGGSMLYVGETRDSETAVEILRTVTNGHLVFTTLHSSDIISGIKRFVSLAVGSVLSENEVKSTLGSSLRMILHQRLRDIPAIQNKPASKKLETSFLLSANGTTTVANKIKTSGVDTISSDIQQQKNILEHQGIEKLMEDWNKKN